MTTWRGFAGLLAGLALLTGCATIPAPETRNSEAFVVDAAPGSIAARHAPVFIPEYPTAPYNRVGTPRAEIDDRGREHVHVDPGQATVYFRQRGFETANGAYTNLIYRVHFEQVPFSLAPFHITTGRNSGLFVIITLDDSNRPLLLTTVHTCGCYIAFMPTSYLPRSAWPANRDGGEQRVFGLRLPGVIDYPAEFDDDLRPLIFLKHGTHRVRDIGLARYSQLEHDHALTLAGLRPIEDLDHLSLGNGETTSFFHDSGFRRGYVKGASKPLELLLMSWWSLDLHVGVDKRYGDRDETGTVFYTSLKPWARSASDMWRFAEFLDYWGWKF